MYTHMSAHVDNPCDFQCWLRSGTSGDRVWACVRHSAPRIIQYSPSMYSSTPNWIPCLKGICELHCEALKHTSMLEIQKELA